MGTYRKVIRDIVGVRPKHGERSGGDCRVSKQWFQVFGKFTHRLFERDESTGRESGRVWPISRGWLERYRVVGQKERGDSGKVGERKDPPFKGCYKKTTCVLSSQHFWRTKKKTTLVLQEDNTWIATLVQTPAKRIMCLIWLFKPTLKLINIFLIQVGDVGFATRFTYAMQHIGVWTLSSVHQVRVESCLVAVYPIKLN